MFRGRAGLLGRTGNREITISKAALDDLDASTNKCDTGFVVGQIEHDINRRDADRRFDCIGDGVI